jgi:cytochrome b561
MSAWFGHVGAAGNVHEALKTLLLLAVALHVVGALYQAFVLRSDVMRRMVPPRG